MHITLKHVAEQAGLSIAAVSQALSRTGTVSKQTRERVQKIADKLGYIPNPLLSSLAANRFRSEVRSKLIPIALILPRIGEQPEMRMDEYNQIVDTNREYAAKLGYQLQTWTIDQISDWDLQSRTFYHRGIAGVVIYPRNNIIEDLSAEWDRFAVVMADSNPRFNSYHPVYYDHFELIQRAWKEVRALGYKKIGWALMRHLPEVHDDMIRRASAAACLAATPTRHRIPILWKPEISNTDAVAKWYTRYKPEVIIGFHLGMVWKLLAGGFRIPEDFAFVNLHSIPESENLNGMSVAGLCHVNPHLVRIAIDHMDQLIRHRLRDSIYHNRKVLVNASWKPGESCPPVANRVSGRAGKR